MSNTPKDVFFFIRAYNDLDIQFPLITEFAKDSRFKTRVIFYPCDGYIAHSGAHEAIEHVAKEFDVTFESALDMEGCPLWLRLSYKAQQVFRHWRLYDWPGDIALLAFVLKVLDVGLGKLMRPALLKKELPWLERIAAKWNPALVFSDEVLFQPGRSALIDNIVPRLIERGAAVYTILTGHRVYTDVNPTGTETPSVYRPSQAKRYFVPSAHNKRIYTVLFPKENITVAGNLRMDSNWVQYLHDRIFHEPAPLPQKPVKIVMMLSKMNYGVEAEQIKETIRRLGNMEGVALAIKPHTRGMRFDFMKKEEIGHAIIVDKIPSAALIEWGDIILMTGSSIVFHAMLRGKVAGFLKYCQNLETIFDDGKSCKRFDGLDELVSYAQEALHSGGVKPAGAQQGSLQGFINHEIHGEIKGGLVAQHYKEVILTDMGLEEEALQNKKEVKAS